MIRKIKTFSTLSRARKKMIVQAFGLSIYTSLLFTFFKSKAGFGQKITAQEINSVGDYSMADDIAFAISIVSKYTPWKNVCRHQAYQARQLCNYYKIPCLIFIGFKKENNEIQAHAWTTVGSKIITGFCNPDEYIVQSIYKNQWQ